MATDWAKRFQERSRQPAAPRALARRTAGPSFGAEFGSGLSDATVVPALLAYRQVWDPFVMGVARAELACSENPKYDAPTRTFLKGNSDLIVMGWNQFAGLTAQDIALRASSILDALRKTVGHAQSFAASLKTLCPEAAIPPQPQDDAIASAERGLGSVFQGVGLAATGLGQLAGTGVQGAEQTIEGMIPGSGVEAPGFLGPMFDKYKKYIVIAGALYVLALVGPALIPMLVRVIPKPKLL